MKKNAVFLFLIISIVFCKKNDSLNIVKNSDSPYEIFFDKLKLEKLTDTILIYHKTPIFGCGKAYTDYQENLIKNKSDKFYDKYGSILDNDLMLRKFEIKHKTKIIYVSNGNEGEQILSLDSTFINKKGFVENLYKTKNSITLSESSKTLDSLEIDFLIDYKNPNKTISNKYFISQLNNNWKIDKISEQFQ